MRIQIKKRHLKLPIVVVLDRVNGPDELLAESLGKELLDRNVKLLGEHYRKTGVDVVLGCVSRVYNPKESKILTILLVPSATSLLPSRSSA